RQWAAKSPVRAAAQRVPLTLEWKTCNVRGRTSPVSIRLSGAPPMKSVFRPLCSAVAVALAFAAVPAMAQSPFSKTVFFGDSLTDTGHFRPVLVQLDPNAGIVGRFTTNPGWVWSDHLADYYGTDAQPNGNGQNGDNYAVGGARVGVDVMGALGPITSMKAQLDTYLAANGGKVDASALYSVWGGANDLFAVAAGAPADRKSTR